MASSAETGVQNENVNSGNLKSPLSGKQRAVKKSLNDGSMAVDQVLSI